MPRGERTSLSMVTSQSDNAGRHSGSVLGEGGGDDKPVKPHNPSCKIRGAMEEGRSGGVIGNLVQISVCSISGGTNDPRLL